MIILVEPRLTFSSASNMSAPGAVPSWLLPPMTMAYGRPPPPIGSVAQEWSTLAPVGGVKKVFWEMIYFFSLHLTLTSGIQYGKFMR